MGKRGAEKYLTDRNADDEDDEDEVQMTGSSEGFKQAAPTELARRPIRGLPGKRSSSSTPAASPAPNGTAPKGSFSFGSPAPTTSFSFGSASATASSAAKPATNGFSFGTPSSSSSSAPKSSATQGNADQDAEVAYYTSLRGLNLSVLPPLQRLLEKDPFADVSEALAKILAKYKEERSTIESKRKASSSESTSRQGQNEASSKPANTTSAPTSIAQSSKPMFSFAAPSSTPSPAASTTNPSGSAAPAASSAPAAPKPFAGFAFGSGAASPTPTATTPAPASDKPAAPKPFSGFSFGAPVPSSDTKKAEEPKSAPVPPKPEVAKGPAPPAAPAAFSFAGNTFKPDPSKASSSLGNSSTSGGFTFNPSKAEKSEEKSSFAFPPAASPAPAQDESKLSPEPSSSNKSSSNNLSGTAAPFFPGANSRARQPSPLRQVETFPSETKKPEEPPKAASSAPKPFTGFSFGAPATSTSTTSSTPPKSFSFGSSTSATSPKATGSFGFGTSGGSPKAPSANVGFSFGSPQPTPSTTAPATSGFSFGGAPSNNNAPATTSAFGSTSSFGGSTGGFGGFSFKPSTVSTGSPFGTSSASSTPGPSTTNGTPAPEDSAAPNEDDSQGSTENSLLKGGAGEENEETIYEARAKLWKNEKRKVKEGDSEVEKTEFVEHGISIVKLNRNKETGKVRMLGRSDANGRVQINFAMFKDLTIKLEKSFLIFMAFEDGQPMLLRLKLRNAELAGNLKTAIEAEVAKLS